MAVSEHDFMRAVALLPGEQRDLETLAGYAEGAPELLGRGIALLVDGTDEAGPIAPADAGWSWLLREIADRVSGVCFVEREPSIDVLVLRDRALEIDHRLYRWRVGPLPEPPLPALLERTRMGLELHISPELRSLMKQCEVHCVTGCCGLAALCVDGPTMRPWVERSGPEGVARVIAELENIVEATEGMGEIVSMDFNARWAPDTAGPYLRGWIDALRAALALVEPSAR